jgi:hypothetical protein
MSDETTTIDVPIDDGMGGEVQVDQGAELDPFQQWANGQPSDVQERLGNAGVKDFDHLARTWSGAEDARQRMQSERDRMMSQYAEQPEFDYGNAVNAPGGGDQQFESMNIPGMDELLPLFGHDEARVMDFVAQQRIQESETRIAAMLDERLGQFLAPIQQQQVETQLNEAITEIRSTYGQEFDAMAPDVVALINQQPDIYNSPQGVWAAFGLVQASRTRENAMQQAVRRQADTLEGGVSRAPAVDAGEEILKRMMSAGPAGNDGLS